MYMTMALSIKSFCKETTLELMAKSTPTHNHNTPSGFLQTVNPRNKHFRKNVTLVAKIS